MSFDITFPLTRFRHPELVSGSTSRSRQSVPYKAQPLRRAVPKASEETSQWTLKRVQGDGVVGVVL
jgi:hypothetical protein